MIRPITWATPFSSPLWANSRPVFPLSGMDFNGPRGVTIDRIFRIHPNKGLRWADWTSVGHHAVFFSTSPCNHERVESWVEVFVFRNGPRDPNVAPANRDRTPSDSLRITADWFASRWRIGGCLAWHLTSRKWLSLAIASRTRGTLQALRPRASSLRVLWKRMAASLRAPQVAPNFVHSRSLGRGIGRDLGFRSSTTPSSHGGSNYANWRDQSGAAYEQRCGLVRQSGRHRLLWVSNVG